MPYTSFYRGVKPPTGAPNETVCYLCLAPCTRAALGVVSYCDECRKALRDEAEWINNPKNHR